MTLYLLFLVNILELQKQPQEINRELKNAREELAIAKENDEPIEGDRFAEAIEVNLIFRLSFLFFSFIQRNLLFALTMM